MLRELTMHGAVSRIDKLHTDTCKRLHHVTKLEVSLPDGVGAVESEIEVIQWSAIPEQVQG